MELELIYFNTSSHQVSMVITSIVPCATSTFVTSIKSIQSLFISVLGPETDVLPLIPFVSIINVSVMIHRCTVSVKKRGRRMFYQDGWINQLYYRFIYDWRTFWYTFHCSKYIFQYYLMDAMQLYLVISSNVSSAWR